MYCCLRTVCAKRSEKQIITDEQNLINELLTKNKQATVIYFDPTAKIYSDNNQKYPHSVTNEMVYAVPNATETTNNAETYKMSMYDSYKKNVIESNYLDVTKTPVEPEYSDVLFDTDENNINWVKEDVFAVPSKIIYTETSEEIFENPAEIITNSISNPAYFSPNKHESTSYYH